MPKCVTSRNKVMRVYFACLFLPQEMGMCMLGCILFLSLAMKIFVGSSDGDTAKLVTEGCCCIGVAILQIFDAIFIHLRIKKGDDGW